MRIISIMRALLLAGMLWSGAALPAGAASGRTNAWDDMHTRGRELLAYAAQVVQDGYGRVPAVMVGLAALLVLPPLTVIGLVLQRRRRGAYAGPSPRAEEGCARPVEAWITIDDVVASRQRIGRSLLRIGRQDDNDLCLAHQTVHGYHALIYHTAEAEFMIRDLTGPAGNGVCINGQRVGESHLADGDRIDLGGVRLKFEAVPV